MRHLAHVIVFLLPIVALAQSPEQVFLQGNEAYRQGNLTQAIDLYESVLHNGYLSGDLYYNLGNAYYRTGNIGRAVLNYERARRLMPGDEDLRHNLQLANLVITDKIETTPRLFLWDWWDGVKNSFSLDAATWWCLFSIMLLLCAGAVFFLARTYRLRIVAVWVAGVGVLCVVLFLSVFFGRLGDMRRVDEAVVMEGVATVKNSPDDRSTDAFVLHAGLKVQTIDKVGTWVKIRLADGKVGWIGEDAVETI